MALPETLRLLWIRGLTESVGHRAMTTEKFLQAKSVTVTGNGAGGVQLYANVAKDAVSYFSQEADRFASASFESLLVVSRLESHPRAVGWLLIRSYYAAFFAAHALMRFHGWACTRILQNTASKLNDELARFYPGSMNIGGGLYLLSLKADTREILGKKLEGQNQGGTHEALWSVFDSYLDESTTLALLEDDPGHQEYVALIDEFKKFTKKFGGSSWFTQLRNRVNYSHEYGAWFPYIKSTCDYDRLSEALSHWAGEPRKALAASGRDELVLFVSACAFLVALCSMNVRDLAFRGKAKSPFRVSSGQLLSAAV